MSRRILDENYFQVSGWMLNRLHLKGVQLTIFAIIYGFSQDGESKFTGSIKYLCEFTGASKSTVMRNLQDLVAQEYLIKDELDINGVHFNHYRVNLSVIEELKGGGVKMIPPVSKCAPPSQNDTRVVSKCNQGGVKMTPNNNIYNNIYNNHVCHDARTHARNKEDDWKTIIKIMGIEYHSPTKKEKVFVDRWLHEWSFTDDMIREAYERCVDSTGRCNFSYIDKILEHWFRTGVSTLDQALTESQKKKRQKANSTASYDIEEYENYDMFGDMGGKPTPHQKE